MLFNTIQKNPIKTAFFLLKIKLLYSKKLTPNLIGFLKN